MTTQYPQDPIQYAHSTTPARSNTFGIVSLVCGCLLCVPFLPGILATIFGFLGLKQAREPNTSGKGLALAGLILGILNLVGWTAYFVLVVAIMVPALGKARTTAGQIVCAANMRQIGQALFLYANENNGQYPPTLAAMAKGPAQSQSAQLAKSLTFACPSPTAAGGTGAAYVYLGAKLTTRAKPQMVVLYEPITNHPAGANFLYGDGSVQFHPAAQAQRIISDLQSGHNPPRVSGSPNSPYTGE